MGISEKIRVLLSRRGVTVTKLAAEMDISRQYLTKKLKNDDFTYIELHCIAEILQCDFEATFIDRKNGNERI